ncbi:MAG: hypothetical protein WCD38_11675 [Candidatus Tumulicola sp.]
MKQVAEILQALRADPFVGNRYAQPNAPPSQSAADRHADFNDAVAALNLRDDEPPWHACLPAAATPPVKRTPDGRVLREATDGEERVLTVCWRWKQGVSVPMPAELLELYRTMRPVHDLPRRPGT